MDDRELQKYSPSSSKNSLFHCRKTTFIPYMLDHIWIQKRAFNLVHKWYKLKWAFLKKSSKAYKQSLAKLNDASLTNELKRSLAILEKYLIKHL